MITIDGKIIAKKIERLIEDVVEEKKLSLSLASLFIGNAADSALYTKRKEEAAQRLHVSFDVVQLDATTPAIEVARKIVALNKQAKLDGYIIQLPLPVELRRDTDELLNLMDPRRDVDGLTVINRERFLSKKKGAFMPTPVAAVMFTLATMFPKLKWEEQLPFLTGRLPKLVPKELSKASATVISDGDVFGPTLKSVFEDGGMDVTVERSDSMTLERTLRSSALVVTAVGKPGFLTGGMVADDAIVIDVGTTLVEGRTTGDADWVSVSQKARAATPVPGGIGPVTVAMLYANLLNLKLHPVK